MTEPAADRPFRKIVVALDASPHSQAALDTAVRIAAESEAKLEGLFIKDEEILRAARLPFAEEVRTHTRSPRQLSDRRAERQLRYQAERAEAALENAATGAEVPHEFRVVEGHVTRELMKAAEAADLLALGKTSTQSSRRRLGTTSRALLSEAPAPVLVLRRAFRRQQPVLTFYDGSDCAALTLRVAAQIAARVVTASLKVLLPAQDDAETDRLRKEVEEQYTEQVPQLQVRRLTRLERDRFALLAQQEGPGFVVMPSGCRPLEAISLQRFLYEIDRPLLVVR